MKVRILKSTGPFTAGQEVDLDDELAKQLCEPREVYNGSVLVSEQKAISLEEAQRIESQPPDLEKMSALDMQVMGLKNIVPTPAQYEAPYPTAQMGPAARTGFPPLQQDSDTLVETFQKEVNKLEGQQPAQTPEVQSAPPLPGSEPAVEQTPVNLETPEQAPELMPELQPEPQEQPETKRKRR